MNSSGSPTYRLSSENGLDLGNERTIVIPHTTCISYINEEEDLFLQTELETNGSSVSHNIKFKHIGEPVKSFIEFQKQHKPIEKNVLIKKNILEEGGGLALCKDCTVTVALAGYWENEPEPFDYTKPDKPMVANLNDNVFLPGIQMAIESMLVGESAVFYLPYQLMYGELGVPPRIKPKADCLFYIRLIRSVLTPEDGEIDFRKPNIFNKVYREVKLLYSSGVTCHKMKNHVAAIKFFKKGVNMLYKCRLANENEQNEQEKLLKKLYINLAVCYNITRQPLKACIACNELNRLSSLSNNPKVLYQNAVALRMIGQFDEAQKRIIKALQLTPDNKQILEEMSLVNRLRESCNKTQLTDNRIKDSLSNIITDDFKTEIEDLIRVFKENAHLSKLTLPPNLNAAEMQYVNETCARENLACTRIQDDYLLDKEDEDMIVSKADLFAYKY